MAGSALLNVAAILAALDITPGAQVADLAAGRTGHFALPLSRLVGAEGRVYAVDILPDVVTTLAGHRAHHSLSQLIPSWGDIERQQGVDLADASLDLALLINTLGTLRERTAAARETVRLVKPNGRIVVIDWQPAGKHPLSKLVKTMSADASDVIFDSLDCRRCGHFTPSPWHWGRVYSS